MRLIFVLSFGLLVAACSAPPPAQTGCNTTNCGGCCDSSGKCISGVELSACGRGGQQCVACPFDFSCVVGSCMPRGGSGGGTTAGGSAGGGDAGGSSAGGAAGGGATAGGAGGGATAGGAGGGATAGGAGGGATAGGAGGGATAGGAGGGATAGGAGGGATAGGTGGGTPATCASGCVQPPGPRCSNANTQVTSAPNGTCINAQCSFVETQTACPYGCANGQCALPSTCTANSRRCNGTQIQTCNSNGSAWLFAQNCTGTCTGGLCDAPCTPAATRCNGTALQTCNSGGTAWQSTMTCGQGCLSGACLTDELVVNGTTVTMEGEYHYAQRVVVRNGGRLQVTTGRKLTIYAPVITVEISSFISGTGASGGTCEAPPDDVFQGIRLIGNQVTIDGSVTWSGASCAKNGLVIRAGTIDGAGTVTSNARSLLLYGAGGVAPGLMATGSTKSLMPPDLITSSNYPEGGLYNDDGPPPLFTWSKPAANVTGYYYVTGSSSAVPVATNLFLASEALAMNAPPPIGPTYLDVVSIDSTGVVGTVPHEFKVNVVGSPPQLASSTNPTPGVYSPNPTVVVAWDGGNPTVGYYRVFDRYPTTRPTPTAGTFEPTNKNPPQVLLQNVADGRWWFHMVALDSMGYSTKAAAHYEVDIGMPPDAGTIAGKVIDNFDAGVVGATVVVQRGLYVATTVAGGVYTFNNTIPAGTYEVVAKDERPDAGSLQARSATVTVIAAMTTEANFTLVPGVGCPTCSDLCSGVSCGADFCLPSTGTCQAGTCVNGTGIRTLGIGVTSGTTVGQQNQHFLNYSPGYYQGPDVTYVFTAPANASYRFTFATPEDHGFYMTTTPPCARAINYQSPWWYSAGSSVNISMTRGQSIFLVVDTDTAGNPGPYTVTVQ